MGFSFFARRSVSVSAFVISAYFGHFFFSPSQHIQSIVAEPEQLASPCLSLKLERAFEQAGEAAGRSGGGATLVGRDCFLDDSFAPGWNQTAMACLFIQWLTVAKGERKDF